MGKLVLITGASGGVGSVAAKHLATQGYNVIVAYTSQYEKAKQIESEIINSGGQALALAFDYQNRTSIKSLLNKAQTHFNRPIDILINNGAIAQEKPFEKIDDDDIDTMFSINLKGPFTAAQEVIPSMRKNNWGRIINIGSIGGQWGGFNQVHYAVAKAGLINLTQSLAKIYSADGISSFTVAIGLVETEMSRNELNTDAGKEKVKNIPAQRLASPQEIAETLSFLCSDGSSYLTGQTLNMNGGMYFG